MEKPTTKPIEEIRQEKIKKIEEIRKQGINPYPAKPIFELVPIIDALTLTENKSTAVAGRITSIRGHGKIRFADLTDNSGKIQIAFKADVVSETNWKLLSLVDLGDFLETTGSIFTTNSGEITIQVTDFNILNKIIRPLPDAHTGFQDKELRFRKRYLDLILNDDAKRIFEIRHSITREMRRFLDNEGLIEVETPTLQPLYGGANAQPFTTKINALDTKAYLRIASELYLKRLMVTGMKGVYDIAKDFRNEGIDQTHFPEFTMMEAYLAYADYHNMMDLMEDMLRTLSSKILDTFDISVHNQQINLEQSWPRTPMTELIEAELQLDILTASDEDIINHSLHQHEGTPIIVGEQLRKAEIIPEELSRGELIFSVFDKLVFVANPTWVIDYPVEVSPLSKSHPTKDGFVERFELYIGGKEIMDGWSEINDPLIQRERFENERERSFEESETPQPLDEDYLEAMEYGMPPMAGVGVGIDRLTMFFSNTWSIQETILFPYKKAL